jgi:hypothetical protein
VHIAAVLPVSASSEAARKVVAGEERIDIVLVQTVTERERETD